MKRTVDIEAILAPIPGDNPAGEDLRYDPIYDEIKEARRADDILDRGDWQRDLKTSDWDKVIKVSIDALTGKTKDLQIAVWLLEALIKTEGFEGCALGLKILNCFLENFWDHVYPEIDDDDLDYRIGPLEFGNEKLSFAIQEIPVTDPNTSSGYSFLNWQEAIQLSQASPATREGLVADGKTTQDEFDSAVRKSSLLFYEKLYKNSEECQKAFNTFDEIVDEKFGQEAPRLSELKTALEETHRCVTRFLKEKGGLSVDEQLSGEAAGEESVDAQESVLGDESDADNGGTTPAAAITTGSQAVFAPFQVTRLLGSGGKEDTLWKMALEKLKSNGVEDALEMLLGASCSGQSLRDKTNCRLLMAKICLRAGRIDLAWPIAEELNKLIEELNLVRWESQTWVADVYGCLYECLTSESATDMDRTRAEELLIKICTTDVTMAMKYSV